MEMAAEIDIKAAGGAADNDEEDAVVGGGGDDYEDYGIDDDYGF